MSTDETFPADAPLDAGDLRVLAGLRRTLDAVDPVPADLVERSLFALSLEALHTQVMELQLLEVPEMAVRGGDTTVEARTITFTAEPVTVMITLSVSPSGGVRIDGWAAPARRYDVELLRPGGSVRTQTDDDGGFVLPDVPPGPAGLVLRHDSGPAVSTPVIEL
ncbi:hypothetical protein [Actinotalea solisilvae]|uniref:hypothetical protein n=1 Tax=Actinotalea solisilvae TaxID=2072922 RepID=UPI0018F1F7F8|nr:hypothetical protein [Actinotalea solisilvae]